MLSAGSFKHGIVRNFEGEGVHLEAGYELRYGYG